MKGAPDASLSPQAVWYQSEEFLEGSREPALYYRIRAWPAQIRRIQWAANTHFCSCLETSFRRTGFHWSDTDRTCQCLNHLPCDFTSKFTAIQQSNKAGNCNLYRSCTHLTAWTTSPPITPHCGAKHLIFVCHLGTPTPCCHIIWRCPMKKNK